MTDEELEKMGFGKFYLDHDIDKIITRDSIFEGIKDEVERNGWFYILTKDRLKAGAEGAKWILESLKRGYLKNDILNKVPIKNGKAAFVDSCLQEAIKNLKIFLGEEK